MANRNLGRSQVRPRPPSTGRPQPIKTRPRAPSPNRLGPHRSIERSAGLPLPARALLALSVVVLGAAVLFAATGGLGRIVAGFGSVVGSAVGRILATPAPSASDLPALGAPTLTPPAESYTNQASVDLAGTVPGNVVGRTDVRIRLYLGLQGQTARPIEEVAAPATTQFTIPGVALTKGSNDFSVTLVAGATESEHSAIVTYVLDTTAPKVTISSPAAGATLNAPVATITGKTQARSSVVAHDTVSGASATTSAAADGTFSLTIALASGSNTITVSATDPAGNVGAATLTLKRGAGRLTAKITASAYQFSARSLPQPITLRATVTNPDGNPLAGANVTFSLSVPGVPAISTDAVTDSNGNATFTTTIPRGATAGLSGPATILVTTTSFGQTTARTTITIRK